MLTPDIAQDTFTSAPLDPALNRESQPLQELAGSVAVLTARRFATNPIRRDRGR